MRPALFSLVLPALVGVLGVAQGVRLPQVLDRSLANGVRLLVVERPGTGVVHAQVFIKGGRANTGGLPPAAADLMARTLFRRATPARLGPALAPLLAQEGGAFESLRLERLAQARLPQGMPASVSPDQGALQALQSGARSALEARLAGVEAWDALDALGATSRNLAVTADYLSYGLDLPASGLVPWLRVEAEQLRNLPMGRFPLERDRLIQEIEAEAPPMPAALSVLLATAMSGRPYALAAEFHVSQVEALGWKDLEAYARWAVVPENLCLVLVGDVKGTELLTRLDGLFGPLTRASGAESHWEGAQGYQPREAMNALESPGGRRLLVSTTGDTRIFFGWRVPPVNHPDGSALRALTRILGGSPGARLEQDLVETRGVARNLSIRMGVPGRRDTNLLVIEAEPGVGHSLGELEQAIQDEILRLQREPLTDQEVRQAQVQLETEEIMQQEDAGTLARALGAAACQGGDWRLAFRALEADGNLQASEIQRVARTYLVPPRATIVVLGPDPLLQPLDATESRLLQVLTALLGKRLGSPAQTQTVLREALRQLRMLSPAEREQTLKLLESQVRP